MFIQCSLACSYKFPLPETRKIRQRNHQRKATQLRAQTAPGRVPEKHDEEQEQGGGGRGGGGGGGAAARRRRRIKRRKKVYRHYVPLERDELPGHVQGLLFPLLKEKQVHTYM